jgi:hypothetical protein
VVGLMLTGSGGEQVERGGGSQKVVLPINQHASAQHSSHNRRLQHVEVNCACNRIPPPP